MFVEKYFLNKISLKNKLCVIVSCMIKNGFVDDRKPKAFEGFLVNG